MKKTKFKQTEIGKIPESWTVTLFRGVLSGNIRHGAYKRKEFFSEDGIRLLKMGTQYSNSRIGHQKMQKVLVSDEELKRFIVKPGNLIFSRTSMMTNGAGKCSLIVEHEEPIIFDGNLLCADLDKKKAIPEFYYYYFNSEIAKTELSKITAGTQSRNISGSELMKIKVPLPKVKEQTSIAKILSNLDSKIELNHAMNQTLEQIAQALFKHWFVDFEFPNEQGKPYKSSGGKMIESELGKIPEGWKVGTLLDFSDLLSGGTPKTEVNEYWGGGIPWVSAKDVTKANGSYLLETERTISKRGVENSSAKMLPKNSIIITARGTVGNYCLLAETMTINQTNYGLKAKKASDDYFVFCSVQSTVKKMKQHSYGTIFDTITTNTFEQLKLPSPTENLIKAFDSAVEKIMEKILLNYQESKKLTTIRDSLLPKLMSGEIRVALGAV